MHTGRDKFKPTNTEGLICRQKEEKEIIVYRANVH